MPGFAGFDTSEFPGVTEMAWLKANTNLLWCGYYLGPAPSHGSTSWMGQRTILQQGGWGLAPIYVGRQIKGPGRHDVSGFQGSRDGRDAVALLKAEGFGLGTCVYLDLEDGPPFAPPRTDYVGAWVDAIQTAGFLPGVYCSHAFAPEVHGFRSNVRVWTFKVEATNEHTFPGKNFPDLHPAGSGFAGSFVWQLAQNCRLKLPLGSPLVDLDTALTADPGAPY